MTARLVPKHPAWTTDSERVVWESLVRRAPDEWTIIANLNMSDAEREHEIDLLVLMPERGIVVLEVKGASVWVEPDGTWRQLSQGRNKAIDPVRQVMGNKYAARAYVEQDPRWRGARVRWGHSIVVPYSSFLEGFSTPDCPRYAVHDRADLDDLAGRLCDIASAQEGGHRAPTAEDCDLLVEILAGRSLPLRDIVADAAEREDRINRLSQEQALVLRATRLLNRVEVRGGAGSGKTVLALTQAKDLTRGSDGRPSQRVALLCYSIGLASMFTRQMAGLSHKRRPAFVGTFEEFAAYLGVTEFGGRDEPDFWERRLPAQMAALATTLPEGRRFDAVVVDEAQDFADHWWNPILGALRDPDTGGLSVYTDENQRIFARFGRPPVALVPLVLDHNLRNTRQIADVFAPLAPTRMRALGGDGPDVTFVPCAPSEAQETADDQVDLLVEQGWSPGHIALVTTGRRHPEQKALQDSVGQKGYWDTFWDQDLVFYGHVLGCKGLERKAVVLCVNESQPQERSREMLYVGLSRATDQLVVVGDPTVIRAMAGPDVAKRLGC